MHPAFLHRLAFLACIALCGCAVQSDYGRSAAGQLVLQSPIAVPSCTNTPGSASITQSCAFTDASTGQGVTSTILLTGLSAEDDVQRIPVVILEVPQGATDFVATFDNGHGKSGRVLVTSGLSVVPIDSRSSLVAEPGMQLAVLELPGDTLADSYAMTLAFNSGPPQLKIMTAAKVTATGSTYYAPLLPCTSNFESLPFVPLNTSAITSTVSMAPIAGVYAVCNGKTYTYTSEPPRAVVVTVYEYYNAALDHYFITWVPAEIAALDSGAIRGWQRTGYAFSAYLTAETAASPVCRYYMPPPYGDSHFFGRGTQECAATGLRNPAFVLEDPAFMYMVLPSAGSCPAGLQPIYRVFSNRVDANHRYMTDGTVRDAMVARGWVAEGDGPDLIVMCAPT